MSPKAGTGRPPAFFAKVHAAARRRWEQLEADADLAGPWRQLFAQVQSPRHVLSELLQNADDAGAKQAAAWVDGDTFVFEHDGEDFDEEQFTSLCRFGFSNKRKLHTIGFRGIGFKSTFSLGPVVEVLTPTLAVAFEKKRFTEPIWLDDSPAVTLTRVRVPIEDDGRKQELLKNLAEWAESPASLLFFQNIRKLVISGKAVERKVIGKGPVSGSDTILLSGTQALQVTVFRSAEESFPEDAIAEIRQERISEDITLPPCRVELVLGLDGDQRLYVILPTEVRHDLPYSCNAPFVQDPARTGIKDPVISPTNRWLLKRLGALAADAMNGWLRNANLPVKDRAKAYQMLPDPGETNDTVAGECERQVREAVIAAVPKDEVLLTTDCELCARDQCIAPPPELYAVWTPPQLVAALGKEGQSVLAADVSPDSRERLAAWQWLQVTSPRDVVGRLELSASVPKPDDWQSLVVLWTAIRQWTSSDWDNSLKRRLKIIPAESQDVLLSAQSVVRLSSAKSRLAEDDWKFITTRLQVLDRDWLSHLGQQRGKTAPAAGDDPKEPARQLLRQLGHDEPTPPDMLVVKAYQDLRKQEEISTEDVIRLTHIMVSLDAAVPAGFDYVTRDDYFRSVDTGLSADLRGNLESILPEEYAQQHLLHPDYLASFRSCTQQQWENWGRSAKSGLRTFVGFVVTKDTLHGRHRLREFVESRRGQVPTDFHLKTTLFRVDDHDFAPQLLAHWTALAASDEGIWVKILELIAEDPTGDWAARKTTGVVQSGYNYEYSVNCGGLPAQWILRLRELPCLHDTHGVAHIPAELLLRTPETEALRDVEPFVRGEMDTPTTRDLLKLLGVRDTPTSLDNLIDRLRALATVEKPPVFEVAKWYSRLDQILPRCDSEELASVKKAFSSERLILTADCEWCTSGEVFQYADEQDVPGTPVVHPTVQSLSLWTRLGIAERPTVDLILGWLKQLESGRRLDGQDVKRVTVALQRCTSRVWEECGHWLSLDRTWVPTGQICYRLTMQRLTPFTDLFPGVRTQTADLRMLAVDVCSRPPFSELKNLGEVIENRITGRQDSQPSPIARPWLVALAQGLQRVRFPDENLTAQVRSAAARLAQTTWQPFQLLKVTPYIAGTPAGQPFTPEVLWHGHTLHVKDAKLVKLFNAVVYELATPFGAPAVTEAIRSCVERDAAFVEEYLEDNFTLEEFAAQAEAAQGGTPGAKGSEGQPPGEPAGESGPGYEEPAEAPAGKSDSGEEPGEEPAAEEPEHVAEEEPEQKPEKPPTPKKPPLIDRYAQSLGYRWSSSQDRFIHPDGSWLQKCDSSFSWERYDADGNVQCRYWVSEQCLYAGGIEMNADLWELIRKGPAVSGLVLLGDDGQPVELAGAELVARVARGEIIVYPAKYRLRRKADA
jgi:hypothetical protein